MSEVRIDPEFVSLDEAYKNVLIFATLWECKKAADTARAYLANDNPGADNTTYIRYLKDGKPTECKYILNITGNPLKLKALEHRDFPLQNSDGTSDSLAAAAAPFILKGFDVVPVNEDGTPGDPVLHATGLSGPTFSGFLNDIVLHPDPAGSYQRLVALFDDNTTATGSRAADRFDTGGGDDTITTGAGDDRVYKWRNGDLDFNGGAGQDLLIFSPFDGDVPTPAKGAKVDLTRGAGVNPYGGRLTLKGVEDVSGTSLDDTLRGDDGDNQLLGNGGNDLLRGEGGDDAFTFGIGFSGEYRGATVDGGAGVDSVSAFAGGSETLHRLDVLDQGLNTGIFRGGSFTNLEDFRFSSDFNPFMAFDLRGGNVAESFHAGSNGDTVDGRGGNDVIRGMGGGDRLDGGAGQDTLDYSLAESFAGVTVNLGANTASGGDAEGDRIANFEHVLGSRYADRITGSGAANRLEAGDGNDTVLGGGGKDAIVGGQGLDRLTGGAGPDRFVFLSVFDSGSTRRTADIVTDFDGADRIDLSAIDPVAGGGDDAFVFRGERGFTDEGQVRVVHAGGFTYLEINVAGALAPDSIIRLNGDIALAAGDFVL